MHVKGCNAQLTDIPIVLLFPWTEAWKLCNVSSSLFCSFLSPVVFNQLNANAFFYFKNPLINYEVLDGREFKGLDRGMKLNLSTAILSLLRFVCMIIYLAVLDIAHVVVLALGVYIHFCRSHAISFLPLFLFQLLSTPFYGSRCLSNFERFRRYHEYCIASPVNMIGFLLLPLFFVSPSLFLFCRGGSQEKDKAVSSSIVSAVQSKITQVLFFAFIPNMSLTQLHSLPNTNAVVLLRAKKKHAKCSPFSQTKI